MLLRLLVLWWCMCDGDGGGGGYVLIAGALDGFLGFLKGAR